MLYIWHEDKKNGATQQFWEFLKNSNVSTKLTNAKIQGFEGNANLKNHIKNFKFSNRDKYIIFMDFVLDNPVAIRYYKEVYSYVKNHNNVYLSNIMCFEYMMLTFKYLETWIKPLKNNKEYRVLIHLISEFIRCIDTNNNWISSADLRNYMMKRKKSSNISDIQNISSEKVAAALINEITYDHMHFRVNKDNLGECWKCNCCYNEFGGKNNCNIYRYHKSSLKKAGNLWNCTAAKLIISKYG